MNDRNNKKLKQATKELEEKIFQKTNHETKNINNFYFKLKNIDLKKIKSISINNPISYSEKKIKKTLINTEGKVVAVEEIYQNELLETQKKITKGSKIREAFSLFNCNISDLKSRFITLIITKPTNSK